MIPTSFGPFWMDFTSVWEPFGSPKVGKRGPTSISKINWIFMSIFNDFWMVSEFKNDGFALNSLGGVRFLDRCVFDLNFWSKNLIVGAQNGPKSELWSDNSAPKIDNNSGSKKRGSKIEKSELKKEIPNLRRRHFGSQAPRKWTLSLITRHF